MSDKKCNCKCYHPIDLLDDKQRERYFKWIKNLPECPNAGAIGGAYTWKFTPTGLGMVIEVERFDGYGLNLTDTGSW